MLVDRRTERSALDSLIAAARAGMGSALVLRGEPGIGKTALLEYAIESASGFRIARAASRRWSSRSQLSTSYASPCSTALSGCRSAARGARRGVRVDNLSDRLLSQRLRELEAEGLVVRTVVPTTPVQVRYELSDRGRELMTALQPLVDWGRRSVR